MIIDSHVHLNNYHDEEADGLLQNLETLRRTMRRNRVDVALILTSYKENPGRPSTRAVLEATSGLTDVYVVAGIDRARLDDGFLGPIREHLQDGTVRGLKLYPGYQPFYPHDPGLEPVYALAKEFRVPVMIHSGDTYSPSGKVKYSHPLHVDEVAVDHPDINFVICHIGNPWIRDCMEIVYKNANVFTDISGLVLGNFTDRFERYMRRQLEEMLLYGVEAENVLFGTDWPISSMETYLEFMETLKIPREDKRKIMAENAARIFRLPVREIGGPMGALRDWLT